MQEVNVAEPGSEPDMSQPIPEDMRVLHADLRDKKGAHLSALPCCCSCSQPSQPAGCGTARHFPLVFAASHLLPDTPLLVTCKQLDAAAAA